MTSESNEESLSQIGKFVVFGLRSRMMKVSGNEAMIQEQIIGARGQRQAVRSKKEESEMRKPQQFFSANKVMVEERRADTG